MVEDANAPPSPSDETSINEDGNASALSGQLEVPTTVKGRGRRGRPPATGGSPAAKAAAARKTTPSPANAAGSSKTEVAATTPSTRPRRSTRTNIDYANPDAATVIAEVDDEEPDGGSSASKTRGRRGRPPIAKTRKRKAGDGRLILMG